MQIYDVNYFVSKFEKTDSSKWCTKFPTDQSDRHCALGWCGVGSYPNGITEEAKALSLIMKKYVQEHLIVGIYICSDNLDYVWIINDGTLSDRLPDNGHTPKERILNVLYCLRDEEAILREALHIINTPQLEIV